MADFAIPNNQREFRCAHCDGKILIPKDLPPTTGPCPHCGGEITSPAPELPPAPPEPVSPPPPVATARPAPTVVPSPVKPTESQQIELPSRGAVSERNRQKTPEKSRRSGLIPAMLVLLAVAAIGGAIVMFASRELGKNVGSPGGTPSGDPVAREEAYIRAGWQKDAKQVLENFMAATTAEAKLPFVLNADELKQPISDFYGDGAIDDSDTPADGFSPAELPEKDRRRGLFLMTYDQPPQFDLKQFFRPLAPLEVQYGVDEADMLLSAVSRSENFEMEPLRVLAFFKRTPQGLKLDWEVFAQTKYRRFLNFTELPATGATGVFRLWVVEDVPANGGFDPATRTYRLTDPANQEDIARITVPVDSEAGKALSVINWRGTKENRPISKTATVELKWSGDANAPELQISRFICWEFLGLGGEEAAN